MTTRDRATAVAIAAMVTLSACGDNNHTATAPSPAPTINPSQPAPLTHNVAGVVRQSVGGNVVSDVKVEVLDGPNAGRSAISDADGRYVLSALVDGQLQLRASRSGYASADRTIVLGAHTTVDFTIVLGSACTLSGTVREFPNNLPSVGAIAAIVREPGGYSAPVVVSSLTDSSGRYQLGGIDCGSIRRLRVEKNDFFPQEEQVLFAGNVLRDVTIQPVTYVLRGFVRDSASGTPLVFATVEVVSGPYAGQKATTFTDGSYLLQVRDTLAIRASKPGYAAQAATVTVSGPNVYKDFALTSAP